MTIWVIVQKTPSRLPSVVLRLVCRETLWMPLWWCCCGGAAPTSRPTGARERLGSSVLGFACPTPPSFCYCPEWRNTATLLGIEKNILYNSVCFPKNYDSVQLFFLTGFRIIAIVSDKMLAIFGGKYKRNGRNTLPPSTVPVTQVMLLAFFIIVDSFSFSSPGLNCKPWLVTGAALEKPAHG